MNLLTKRIIFIKTGLLLLAILFFLGCKREKNKLGLDDPNRLPTNTFFTDTVTIKSEVILLNDSINTTNVTSDTNCYLLAGAYTDPYLGPTYIEAYTRLNLDEQHIELPAATADSAFFYFRYDYFYGDSMSPQTITIHKLIDEIKDDTTYFSNSHKLNYDPSPVGTVNFYTTTDTNSNIVKVKITDMAFIQYILDASKNNTGFYSEMPGIAFIAGNQNAVIRINGSSVYSRLQIYYTQYGVQDTYNLKFSRSSKKFFRVIQDRSSTNIALLQNNYQSISTTLTNNQAYIQSCVGLCTKITFPYLNNLRLKYPNLVIVDAKINIVPTPGSLQAVSSTYPTCTGLILKRTSYDAENHRYSIMKDPQGAVFYVQPDGYSQTVNSIAQVFEPDSTTNHYNIPIRSYLQAVLYDQVENDPIIIAPTAQGFQINRLIFNDNSNSTRGLKLNLYYTVTK